MPLVKELKNWDVILLDDGEIYREQLYRLSEIARERLEHLPVAKSELEGDRTILTVSLPTAILGKGALHNG